MSTIPHTFESYATKRTSFVLSTKNRADLLEKALANCRSFVEPEDELIVIDGASEDHTKDVIKKYSDLIDVFVSEPDIKSAHAANKGALLARGKYIKFLTDDDEFYPEAITKAIETLEAHPEIDLLLCGGSVNAGGRMGYVYVPPGVNFGKNIKDFFQYPQSGGSQFFRRSALANIGLIPLDSVRPDGEMTFQAFYAGVGVRFCRVHSFRHYKESHQGIITSSRTMRKERNMFYFAAAKKAFPRTMYWKYRLVNTAQGSGLFRMLRRMRRIWYRRIGVISESNASPHQKPRYLWDGGLS